MKKLIIVLALVAIVSTGAFAQGIGFGLSVNQYYMKDATMSEAWSDFREGNGQYWGGFGEIMGRNYALGMSLNFMVDAAEPGWYYDPLDSYNLVELEDASAYDMWNYDLNIYLAYHFFGTKAIIDPFIQAGFGIWAYDYMNKDELSALGWTVYDDPLMGSAYFDIGAGIGINLGSLGIFAKGMYNIQSKKPLYGEDNLGEYEIFELPVMPFKWTFGAKVLL